MDISSAVSHSPVFLEIAGQHVDLSDIPSHTERAKMVANDPVSAANIFFVDKLRFVSIQSVRSIFIECTNDRLEKS